MCNKGIECLDKSRDSVDNQQQQQQQRQQHHQALGLMMMMMNTQTSITDSTTVSPNSCLNDESPRVKFLCSFLGSIMPRPQDGKLRYVGGETRIVCVSRDIGFEELMNKMRELYEGAAILKYQQPDEDLDALVSVVNDDDVTNMMEEYEKLGSGDGFTRLRIFLFPHSDQDGFLHYVDGDDRDTERRYVDALNNLNDGVEYRRQQPESPLMTPIDDMCVQDQFFNPLSLDGGSHHGQRGGEMPIPQYNLHHVVTPQRYNEADGPWSHTYFSPRHHHGHHDPRPLLDFPNSPPSWYHVQSGDALDRGMDRFPEEYSRLQFTHHPVYEHQPPYSDKAVRMPSGSMTGDRAGFPGNLMHVSSVFEGNNVCEHCRVTLQRNQIHLEQQNVGNGPSRAVNPCAECTSNRDNFLLSPDSKVHNAMYPKDQNDPRSLYSETQNHERGWILQHQLTPHADDVRIHVTGAGRFNDHFTIDGPSMNYPLGHANLVEGHQVSSNYIHHRAGPEVANEVFHDQALTAAHNYTHHQAGPEVGNELFHEQPVPAPLLHIQPAEGHVVRQGNFPYAFGAENVHPMPHGHIHACTVWRNVQNPVHAATYEASNATPLINGTVNSVLVRGTTDGSQGISIGMDNQHPWVHSSQKMVGFDGTNAPQSSYGHALDINPNICGRENKHSFIPETTAPPVTHEIQNSSATSATTVYCPELSNTHITEVAKKEERIFGEEKESNHLEKGENLDMPNIPCPEKHLVANTNCLWLAEESGDVTEVGEKDSSAVVGDSKSILKDLTLLPELIATVKKAALVEAEEVKARVEEHDPLTDCGKDVDPLLHNLESKEATVKETEAVNVLEGLELDSDNDNVNVNKIEPTKAEAEAIARGLQTIKNDDLEEVRELGSGTYGAVYHGKWKGSDVAIKRIKASCFAGRPSERERLIADFWKEALILSSLHHPNVVSFYGIVRDGPDGSLATVTEFMINGSLKQFLRKKDRTIDRRKRFIIAMDAAFGMEYLHGKNIVHFDLKCENLLVNMRDPQRPVCKIGDLGLSKVKQHTLVSGGVRGTLPWMAPELLSGKSHMVSEKIDVYSFGIVMWELLTGEEPYVDMHCASIIGGIVSNTLRPQIPTWCDPEWKSLMESCWASDPAERPSFSEISHRLRTMAAAINVR
uniref:Uncharacterized protein MANES_06G025700 n=2 Tax=Rhizophora mucronata TaxID=61149 RepID=A0A2P2JZV6_RHIMU